MDFDYFGQYLVFLISLALLVVVVLITTNLLNVSFREVALFVYNLTYMTVAKKTFGLFRCDDSLYEKSNVLDRYLIEDYNVICGTWRHLRYEVLGILIIIVWCIAPSLVFLHQLWP